MSMLTISTITASVSALALAGTLAASDSADAGPRHGKIESLCKRLECTDEQRDELRTIATDLRSDLREKRGDVKVAKKAIADEYRKGNPNERVMKRNYEVMDRHRKAVRARTHRALMQAHAVLTPDQRGKLANRIEKRGPKAALSGRGKGKAKAKAKAKGKRDERRGRGHDRAHDAK